VRFLLLLLMALTLLATPGYGEMYKWVDERGTVHFTDDLSKIPEKYRADSESRKTPKEISSPEIKTKPASPSSPTSPKAAVSEGIEAALLRKHEVFLTEVILNGKVKQNFVVDTGASFTLINRSTARELSLTVDETTPRLPVSTVSDVILCPLMTLRSVQVGKAGAENVEALIYNMPSDNAGLLGNSFLNKFKVVIDSINAKITFFPLQGIPSPDRPGGYNRDYWVGQFRYYNRNLDDLRTLKARYEARGKLNEAQWINNALRHFEDQLNELERRASFAGVPRNWRE
jgi:clan AA aspartic protease (TIGR02281 family)